MKKIAIVGGAGFIGSSLVKKLNQRDEAMRIIKVGGTF